METFSGRGEKMIRLMLTLLMALNCSPLFAKIDLLPFRDNAQEMQWREITQSLRCPKCQNSSIADSDAMIADDMRIKVFELQQQGKSRQQIIEYMTVRYGEFVSYQPPVTGSTIILWLVPFAILLAGGILIFRRSQSQRYSGDAESVHYGDKKDPMP